MNTLPDTWNPTQYLKFNEERTQPAVDLVCRVSKSDPKTIVDLGCGSGNSTAILRSRWPQAAITGVDGSLSMLDKARASDSSVEWVHADIATWAESKIDLIFSNAALHWIPDHRALLPKLVGILEPEGVLAFQIPYRFRSILHDTILVQARQPKWASRMEEASIAITAHDANYYYDVLSVCTRKLRIWVTEYYHIMPNHESIIEWVRGTALQPFIKALGSGPAAREFEADLLSCYRAVYPLTSDGSVALPFRRLFVLAER